MINLDRLLTLVEKLAETERRLSEIYDLENDEKMWSRSLGYYIAYSNIAQMIKDPRFFEDFCDLYEVDSDEKMDS